jgi:phosphohistidine phosphatase
MRLLMMRHEKAVASAATDAERPLTTEGRERSKAVGKWLAKRGVSVETILHSRLDRARQTAERFASGADIDYDGDGARDWLGPSIDLDALLGELRGITAETVLVVSHQPDISTATTRLCRGGEFHFRPGTIVCVEFRGLIAEGQATIEWVLSPEFF